MAGTTVTWQFTDGRQEHNVTGDGWSSPLQSTGTFTHTFYQPGAYAYRCICPGHGSRVVVTRPDHPLGVAIFGLTIWLSVGLPGQPADRRRVGMLAAAGRQGSYGENEKDRRTPVSNRS